MTRVDQIKHDIETLSDHERTELHNWLLRQEWTDDDWDRQMREDANTGALQKLAENAREEIRRGQTKDLP